MQYRILGKTGLKVSLLSFGTGGPSQFGQKVHLSAEEQSRLVHRCHDLGINLFDSSCRYGNSEELLGAALKGIPRDSYILSTKWGAATSWSAPGTGASDGSLEKDPESLTRAVIESLKRLNTDHIDIMQLHGLRRAQYDEVVERFHPVLQRLKKQGMIRFIGFSERFVADPKHETVTFAIKTNSSLWDTVMLKYGILNQYAAHEALPLAQEAGVGVINMAAVRIKLPRPAELAALIEDWKIRGLVPTESLPSENPLGWVVRDNVTSIVAAGYKFAADHPGVATVLTGTSNLHHLEDNVAALESPFLPELDRARLVKLFGHIAEYA